MAPAEGHGPALPPEGGDDGANRRPDGEPGRPDEAARRPGLRELLRRSRTTLAVYRTVVAVLGVGVIGVGVVLLPLPGPGWLVIFVGLGILATEFAWAERLLHYARSKVRSWTRWVGRQPVPLRLLIGAAGLVLVAAIVVVSLRLTGVPDWVPWWVPLIR